TMPAADVGAIPRRVFLVHLHIGGQAAARVAALHQVMTEDAVVGKAPVERAFEGIYLVDALADEGALAEQILVHVADGARIWVDARLASEQARVTRLRAAGQAHTHSRLQDTVTLADALPGLTVARPIQGMRHGAHQLAAGIARQL